jgi:hypothetical protein
VITKVQFKIRSQGPVGTNPFNTHNGLKVDIRKGTFSGSAVLQLTDFKALSNLDAVGTFGKTPLNNWYTATLTSAAYPLVNRAGLTQFRLRFLRDDNDDRSADYMKFLSGNHASISVRPLLIVQYYVRRRKKREWRFESRGSNRNQESSIGGYLASHQSYTTSFATFATRR